MNWHTFYLFAGPVLGLVGGLSILLVDKLRMRFPRLTDDELLEKARAEHRKATDMIRRADKILKNEPSHNIT